MSCVRVDRRVTRVAAATGPRGTGVCGVALDGPRGGEIERGVGGGGGTVSPRRKQASKSKKKQHTSSGSIYTTSTDTRFQWRILRGGAPQKPTTTGCVCWEVFSGP